MRRRGVAAAIAAAAATQVLGRRGHTIGTPRIKIVETMSTKRRTQKAMRLISRLV